MLILGLGINQVFYCGELRGPGIDFRKCLVGHTHTLGMVGTAKYLSLETRRRRGWMLLGTCLAQTAGGVIVRATAIVSRV